MQFLTSFGLFSTNFELLLAILSGHTSTPFAPFCSHSRTAAGANPGDRGVTERQLRWGGDS